MAAHWFDVFEGAGLDGVIAKRATLRYLPGKREMAKIKHLRTADCVVAGFRWHKNGPGTMVGSLLLGLWNDAGQLQHVGVTSSFTAEKRRELVAFLEPLPRRCPGRPSLAEWKEWEAAAEGKRMPGATSRWNRGKDLSWEPLRPELVCEVAFDHLQGDRFRHATTFKRWRPDKPPAECRYDQLEETPPALLADLFGLIPNIHPIKPYPSPTNLALRSTHSTRTSAGSTSSRRNSVRSAPARAAAPDRPLLALDRVARHGADRRVLARWIERQVGHDEIDAPWS